MWSLGAYAIWTYYQTNHWFIGNIFAMSFSIYAIENWLQTHFFQLIIISVGLIAYDVFFVFGSDVMMTVAKGMDMPMKILFPVNLPNGGRAMAMLGIGDIIIPGLIVSFCIRADYIREMQIQALILNKRKQ